MIRGVLLGVVAIISLLFGLIVLRTSRRQRAVRLSFFFSCLCMSVWAASLEVLTIANSQSSLDIASRWSFSAATLFPLSLMVFMSHAFLRLTSGLRSLLRVLLATALVALVLIWVVPEFILRRTIVESFPIDLSAVPVNQLHFFLFSLFFTIYFIITITIGGLALAHSRGLRRRQLRVYLLGLSIATVPSFVANLILPCFGDYRYTWIGPLTILLFLMATTYSIARYHMMDIRSTAARILSLLLLIGTLAVIYFAADYLISILIFQDISPTIAGADPLNMVLAIILTFSFQPIKRFFDSLTDKIFYYNEIDPDEFRSQIGLILTRTSDLQLLSRRIAHYIAHELHADKVVLYIPQRGTYGKSGRRRSVIAQDDIEKIMKYYRRHYIFPEAMLARHIKCVDTRALLKMYRTQIVLPLLEQNQEIGLLLLGEHKGVGYNSRNIYLLESVASGLSVAVQNALSVEEANELNATLQRRIDEATKELRLSNRQLQRLDQSKNDFISMASHQLRTPLTSIKGYLDMLLQGDLGRVSAAQKVVLREAFSSSERMVRLISDFLDISRLQTGKFVIDRRSTDLVKLVKEEVAMMEVMSNQKSIQLKVDIDKTPLPNLEVDTEKIRQVILNFIDNAIHYSPSGSLVVICLTRKDREVEFTVKDSGIGVPKAECSSLFNKFFRASNARKKRPDGTGVGLFLAKKVILSHGGEILFLSEEGKGSVFGFLLPIGAKADRTSLK